MTQTLLPDYILDFLEDLTQKGRQPSTIKRYRYDLEDFLRWMKKTHGSDSFLHWRNLSEIELHQFFLHLLDERSYTSSTAKRIHSVLKQLYRYYEAKGTLTSNPLLAVDFEPGALRPLVADDFLSSEEIDKLLTTVKSKRGLTENQLKARPLLTDRNLSIFQLLLELGLTLHELVSLNMKDIQFQNNSLYVPSDTSLSRTINMNDSMKQQIYTYIHTIPKPVRPRYRSNDPLFTAFDFQRLTYRWVYEIEQPKRLTEIAIQKMIREEVKRSGIRKGISAQHMRNTCILTKIKDGWEDEQLTSFFGFKTAVSLKKYRRYYETIPH